MLFHELIIYEIPAKKLVKKCDKCDTEFKSSAEMDSHLEECHKSNNQFKCKECDKIWVSHLSLELHYAEIHKKIMICCDICGHASKSRGHFNNHTKAIHTKSFDNVCHLCGKSYLGPSGLKQHLAVDHGIGEPKHKCDICGKQCQNSAELKNHTEAVHLRNVIYSCDQCPHTCFSKTALGKHKLKKHKKQRM